MITVNDNLLRKLEKHPVFESLKNLQDLRVFMEHHVFAVWDFMSLLKALQGKIAPHGSPWLPSPNTQVVRLVNEIVLEEESDVASPKNSQVFASHFEIYLKSMKEVAASSRQIDVFLNLVRAEGIITALECDQIPKSMKKFMASTFRVIEFGKPHEIAASFAYGREKLVPLMFLKILESCQVGATQAPLFHYYLERHAHLDGEQHGPMAEKLVVALTDGDPEKEEEAREAAESSIISRIQMWDEVLLEMPKNPIVA